MWKIRPQPQPLSGEGRLSLRASLSHSGDTGWWKACCASMSSVEWGHFAEPPPEGINKDKNKQGNVWNAPAQDKKFWALVTTRARLDRTSGRSGGSVIKSPPALQDLQEKWVRSPSQEDPLEKEMATHSRIFAWRIPWTGGLAGYSPRGSQRSQKWLKWLSTHTEWTGNQKRFMLSWVSREVGCACEEGS